MFLISETPVPWQVVHERLLAEGFSICVRVPATKTEERTRWERGPIEIGFTTSLVSGLAFFHVTEEPEARTIVERIAPCRPVGEVVREDLAAEAPAAQARAAMRAYQLGRYVDVDPSVPRAALAEGLMRWLASDHEPVRRAAIEAAFMAEWPELEPALLALAARHPHLAWVETLWGRVRRGLDEAARVASEKKARADLLASLVSLVEEGRFAEALEAADRVLAEKKPAAAAWRTRTLALAGLGRRAEAFVWAAFWLGKGGGEEARGKLDELASALDAVAAGSADLGPAVLLAWEKLDDTDDALAALGLLRERAGAREIGVELAFIEAALRVRKSYSRDKQKGALALLEGVTARLPALVDAWLFLALARGAHEDVAGAEDAYRRALAALANDAPPSPREEALARFARALSADVPTRASVWRSLAWLYESQSKRHEDLFRVTGDELADPGSNRAAAWKDHAIAATFTNRHDEAIAAYRAALDAGHEDAEGLLHFNLACELARQSKKAEALAALRGALQRSKTWAKKARGDEYFAPLWDDADFRRLVLGRKKKPKPEEVERLIARALGYQTRGDGDEALEAGDRAVEAAELLGDPALLARALAQHGSVLTYHKSPTEALRTLERARSVAEKAFAKDPVLRARILHPLGAAHHAAKGWAKAQAVYEEVLALREAALGPDTFEVAITYGDLARLACDQARWDEGAALQLRSREALLAALDKAEGDDRLDILYNLALNEGNRAWLARERRSDPAILVERAEDATGFLERLAEGGGTRPAPAIQNLRHVLASATGEEVPDDVRTRAFAVAYRLLVLEHPDPKVRAEKMYWNALRLGMRELKARGATDAEIAAGLGRAVRGQDPGEPIGSHPAFANLSVELARRLTGATDLVMVAMSLDLAASGAQPVDEAIGGLEAFALANLDSNEG